MVISYYVHAWQGLLMFLAGIVSVLAAFAGYVQSGGGEELLRRALANLQTGSASFKSTEFNWLTGVMVVKDLTHQDYVYSENGAKATISGLKADELRVKLDLYPWPPEVKGITVLGMHNTDITVSDGFFQSAQLPRALPEHDTPPI